MSTSQEIAEAYVEDLAAHPARHGLDLWLTKGFAFGRLPTRALPNLSKQRAPMRGRVRAGGELRKRRANTSSALVVNNLAGVRAVVADMRRRGCSAAAVQHYVRAQTTFTLRKVFSACSDDFERACYATG